MRREVRSYDVFDTVLTRLVAHPAAVFALVAARLCREGVVGQAASVCREARIAAEAAVRLARPGSEVTLADIVDELAWRLGFSREQAAKWMEAEVEMERRLCRGVPALRSEIGAARRAGVRIQFVSDMYLSREVICELLVREEIAGREDAVWVSSSEGASKRSGDLFSRIATKTGSCYADWVHHGDRRDSDVNVPRSLGIRAVHRTHCDLNHFERVLESFSEATEGTASILAGASRFARLAVEAQSAHERGLVSVGAGVVGPVLVSYVAWVLRMAQERGLQRLYFVARDGYLLLEIARRLERQLQTGVDLRYLYGSRQAWHLPGLDAIDDVAGRDWIAVRSSKDVSAVDMLQRVGLSDEECERLVGGLTSDGAPPSGCVELVKAVLSDKETLKTVQNRALQARASAQRYFAQEGLFDDVKWAIVDVGWRARAQQSLKAILGSVDVNGLYFGLQENACGEEAGTSEAFLFDGRRRVGTRLGFSAFDAVLEMFCQAPHGMTLGYHESCGKVIPMLREEANEQVISWGLEKVHETVVAFVDNLPVDLLAKEIDLRPCVAAVLDEFWRNPSFDEASAWGDFGIESDQRREIRTILAPACGVADVVKCLFRGRVKSSAWHWESAVRARTPNSVRVGMAIAERVHFVCSKLLKRIGSIFRRRKMNPRTDTRLEQKVVL